MIEWVLNTAWGIFKVIFLYGGMAAFTMLMWGLLYKYSHGDIPME